MELNKHECTQLIKMDSTMPFEWNSSGLGVKMCHTYSIIIINNNIGSWLW